MNSTWRPWRYIACEKYELPTSRLLKVIVWQTDWYTDIHTYRLDQNYIPRCFVGGQKAFKCLLKETVEHVSYKSVGCRFHAQVQQQKSLHHQSCRLQLLDNCKDNWKGMSKGWFQQVCKVFKSMIYRHLVHQAQLVFHIANAVVAIDSSHLTVSSSASQSSFAICLQILLTDSLYCLRMLNCVR